MATSHNLGVRNTVIGVAIAIAGAVIEQIFGLHQKWHTALLIVLAPFWVISCFSNKISRSSQYWKSFFICLCLQICVVWLVFAIALKNVDVVGMYYAIPIIMIEAVVIQAGIVALERRLAPS